MVEKNTDEQIRKIILIEYYKRRKGVSKNPETHILQFSRIKRNR